MATVVTGETLAAFNESRMPDPFANAEQEAAKAEEKAKEIKAAEEKETKEPEAIEDDDPKEEPKEEKPKKGKLAERFSELTGKARQAAEKAEAAEARANALAAELEALKKPARAENEPTDKKPDPKDYTDAFEYAEKLAEWSVKDAFARKEAQDAQAREEQRRQGVLKTWTERLESAKQRYPDFEEMMVSSGLGVTDKIRDKIVESQYGPDILYFLASDDEAAASLKSMDDDEALQYLGELRATFKAAEKEKEEEKPKAEKPKPKLPAPITPIKAKAASNDPVRDPGEFNGTYAEWKALRLKGR